MQHHLIHITNPSPSTSSRGQWPFTFWTWSRCGQVRVRGGFQQGTLLPLVFFILSESSSSRKEHRLLQSTRPSFAASLSRMRPRCSWVTTTLSNKRPYSSWEPRPTDDQAKWMNSALDKERDAPDWSCTRINSIMRHSGIWVFEVIENDVLF